MNQSVVLPLLLRFCAPEMVGAAFAGILSRLPEPEAVNEYCRDLAKKGRLVEVLAEIARSDEAWQKAVEQRAADLVRALFHGLLGRDPEAGVLQLYSGNLAETRDIAGILAEIGGSSEHWEKQLSRHAAEIVRAAFVGVLAREPDAVALNRYVGELAATKDITALLVNLVESPECWARQLEKQAETVVRAIFRGLLKREPEAEALSLYSAKLAESKDIDGILADVDQSPEHWENQLSRHAAKVVQAAFVGLMGREPGAEALEQYAGEFAANRDFANLFAELSKHEEHWENLLEQKAEALVGTIYLCILKRQPSERELCTY